jgi:hypothetical protein
LHFGRSWYGCCKPHDLPAVWVPEKGSMMFRNGIRKGGLAIAVTAAAALSVHAQTETYTATASIKAAGGAAASAPVTIVVERKMSPAEAEKFLAAFKSGGAAALHKALAGVPPTGSVQVGGGAKTPTRLTLERSTDKGRLLTIVSDTPILQLGAGVPGAKPKEGYDFAIVDLELPASGAGTGTFAPAAKVTVKQGVFVVDDYSGEILKLASVTRK